MVEGEVEADENYFGGIQKSKRSRDAAGKVAAFGLYMTHNHHSYFCFLADVHLSEARPDVTAAFRKTLAYMAQTPPEALYILGDLFDYWLGDDLLSPYHKEIAAAIAALPCPVYFQHGNRDFLLTERYAKLADMTLLPEREVVVLGGQRVLLEHGDLLCTDDRGYQWLRCVMRCRPLQRIYYGLPTGLRRWMGSSLRQQSRTRTRRKAPRITNTSREAIARVMRQYQASVLVHGHTHRPAVDEVASKKVFVLGDWRPYGEILCYREDEGFSLLERVGED